MHKVGLHSFLWINRRLLISLQHIHSLFIHLFMTIAVLRVYGINKWQYRQHHSNRTTIVILHTFIYQPTPLLMTIVFLWSFIRLSLSNSFNTPLLCNITIYVLLHFIHRLTLKVLLRLHYQKMDWISHCFNNFIYLKVVMYHERLHWRQELSHNRNATALQYYCK